MLKWLDQQDPTYAAALVTAAVFALAFFLAGVTGWFGVGLVGLAGLVLAKRYEHSEGGVAGGLASISPYLDRKQLEEQAREDPRKRAADAGARQRMFSIIKTIALAVAALGIGGGVLHWS